jgi:hypothetical protein
MVDCSREIEHESEHNDCLWCCWCDCFEKCHISRSECDQKEMDYFENLYKGGFGTC